MKRSAGREKWSGVCGRSAEDKGAERKAKESAGEGQKVAEASGTRLEATEEVVDAGEAGEANQRFQGGHGSGDKDT